MCKAMRDLKRDWLQEGRQEKVITLICKNLARGISAGDIAEFLGEPLSLIEKVCAVAKKQAPTYDVDKIYQELHGENS